MSEELPVIYLARHGETAWSLTGQYTGLTDLPLTERGERNARRLRERLKGIAFAKVFTSPLQRAVRTCELAGFGAVAEVDHDLVEWNYGEYEGHLSSEIHAQHPDWQLFRDGCPGGESPVQVTARADRVIGRVLSMKYEQETDGSSPSHRTVRTLIKCPLEKISTFPLTLRTLPITRSALAVT